MRVFKLSWLFPGILTTLILSGSSYLSATDNEPTRALRYVNHAATGSNNGSSWANAYTSLQSALNAAVSGDQIWVAKGTYKPSYDYGLGGVRYNHFRMINGVAIYGGFSGTETAVSQRTDFRHGQSNETILSGDIGTVGTSTDNCYNVIYNPSGLALTNTSILDGFTVRDGYGDNTDVWSNHVNGAGICNISNNPRFENLTVMNNFADQKGALFFSNSTVEFRNSTIQNNASRDGGGFYSVDSTLFMEGCLIINNSAYDGGGGYVMRGTPLFTNCTISKNTAGFSGGGLCFYGHPVSIPTATIRNCIVWGNDSYYSQITNGYYGKQIALSFFNLQLQYTCYSNLLYGDVVQLETGWINATNCVTSDPGFIDADLNDFTFYATSVCYGTGNNLYCDTDYDVRGQTRIQNGTIDMGAIEWTQGVDPAQRIVYVNSASTGNNDGSSWANAYTSLQTALDDARAGNQLWVAKGTHKPSSNYGVGSGERYNHFRLKDRVSVYGGFSGVENNLSERTSFGFGEENETILSGDLGVEGNTSDNCYHVVYNPAAFPLSHDVVLNGFTIRDGNANFNTQASNPANYGGGIYIDEASLYLEALVLTNNNAVYGGAISENDSDLLISGCQLFGNSATYGGAVRIAGNGTKQFNYNKFYDNTAVNGGALDYSGNGSMDFINCSFYENNASTGAAVKYNGSGNVNYTNCLFYENNATNGGAIWNTGYGNLSYVNCTIAGNSATYNAGAIYNSSVIASINNCIIWGNTSTVGKQLYLTSGSQTTLNYSCYGNATNDVYVSASNLTATNHNVTSNPMFFHLSPYYRIMGVSPCVNAGNNLYNDTVIDVRDNPRVQDSIIDMGAYEWTQGTDPVQDMIYVKHDAPGLNDGSSWQNAYTSFQTALEEAMEGVNIWVARGTYYPTKDYMYDIPGDPREKCFRMKKGVEIFGGFAGTETSVAQRSNYGQGGVNETILSGDIGTPGDYSDNCYSVVGNISHSLIPMVDHSAVIDGFTIKHGTRDDGAGIYNWRASSPTIRNVIFTANNGAGIGVHDYASPIIDNCKFVNNAGNGVHGQYSTVSVSDCEFTNNTGTPIWQRFGSLNVSNSTFTGNSASESGAIFAYYISVNLSNCIFENNSSHPGSGATGTAAIYCWGEVETFQATNCSFISNTSTHDSWYSSGAVTLHGMPNSSLSNCVFSNNSALVAAGAMEVMDSPGITITNCSFNSNSAPTGSELLVFTRPGHSTSDVSFNNSIIKGDGPEHIYVLDSSAEFNYSCFDPSSVNSSNSTITMTNNNITTDPYFVDGDNNDLRLIGYSPCVNVGNNSYTSQPTDIRGESRIRDGIIDMGAYEYYDAIDPSGNIIYVKHDAAGLNDGSSWANAFTSLQSALNAAVPFSRIWIARGTYYPSSAYDLTNTPRFYHFRMINDVSIYGGFAGTEANLIERTNHGPGEANETILSGDIGTTGNSSDNCYHVFYHPSSLALNNTAVLDGVTISGGNANYNTSEANHLNFGGAMFNSSGSPYLRYIVFKNNYGRYGGALSNHSSSSPTLVNCLLYQNTAFTGGAIQNMVSSQSTLIGTTIASNSATWGGGINCYINCGVYLKNSIIWGNSATTGNQFAVGGGTSNFVDLDYSCYANGTNDVIISVGSLNASSTTITSDPKFIGVANQDFRLYGTSPARDTGNNSYNTVMLDICGRARVQNDTVDMGAYEWTADTDPAYDPVIVSFTNGAAFTSPASNTLVDTAIGRFALQSDGRDCVFNALDVSLSGDFTGISNFKLWQSDDAVFDPETDLVLGVGMEYRNTDPALALKTQHSFSASARQERSILSFSDFSGTVSGPLRYFFISCDVAGSASGNLLPSLVDHTSINLIGATIQPVFTNAPLVGAQIIFTPPTISISVSSLPSFGDVLINTDSAVQTYSASGTHLLSDLTISVPEGYLIALGSRSYALSSRDPGLLRDFASQLVLSPVDGSVASTLIQVLLHPVSAQVYSGPITHSALYADSKQVEVSGTGVIVPPTITTGPVTDITINSATLAGEVVSGNGYDVTARGLVWNTSPNPSTESYFGISSEGSGTGIFSTPIDGLGSSTTYYVRAYAVNPSTTAYGNEQVFTTLSRIVYVDESRLDDSGDGNSWAFAKKSLQSAMDLPLNPGDQIWVAKGTYYPSFAYGMGDSSRYYHFRLKTGVQIYGGFYGNETSPTQRNSFGMGETNETILSGDIGILGDHTDNCMHVVLNSIDTTLDHSSVLDGFTIRDGYADGASVHSYGGGLMLYTGSPTLQNLCVTSNYAANRGGGYYSYGGSPILNNVTISENSAASSGGGAYIYNCNLSFSNSSILMNNASSGGGMYAMGGEMQIVNCVFADNQASTSDGGALYLYGANTSIINTLIHDNKSQNNGAGIFLRLATDALQCQLTNVTLVANTASATGGGIYCQSYFASNALNINNSIIWENSATLSGNQLFLTGLGATTLNYSNFANGTNDVATGAGPYNATNNNINVNPAFADSDNLDFRLFGSSPCVNSGSNAYDSESFDIRGQARVQDGIIDMGAYEWSAGIDPTHRTILVKHDATGDNDGTSWSDAFTSLQSALNDAYTGDEIWIARGIYKPSYDYGLGIGDRGMHFRLKERVDVYGGFAGSENSLSQRINFGCGQANETILSGDIGENGNAADNCYHVISNINTGLTSETLLNGVTITGGTADAANPHHRGGGVNFIASSPTVRQVVFTGNYAQQGGGAFNQSSTAQYYDCLFFSNQGSTAGGGLRNNSSSVTVTNCTFAENTGGYLGGGGVDNWNSNTTYNNCIFWGNTSPSGNQLHGWGTGTTTLNYSCYSNGTNDAVFAESSVLVATNYNITTYPFFTNYEDNDFRICGNSPARNSGSNAYNPNNYDIEGRPRIQDTIIDMGAYEWMEGVDLMYLQNVIFQDGQSFSPVLINGYTQQAIGMFSLHTQYVPSQLNALTLQLRGSFSGISNYQLWESEDSQFELEEDTLLGSVRTSFALPQSENPEDDESLNMRDVNVGFSGLNGTVNSTPKYYFITCDVAAEANGSLMPVLSNNTAFTFDNSIILGVLLDEPLSQMEIILYPPTITSSVDYLPFFGELPVNTVSEAQSYTIWAHDLQDVLRVEASWGFKISLAEFALDYESELTLTPNEGVIDSTVIYVKFTPEEAILYPGNIIHRSQNANLLYVSVGGEGTAELSAPQNVTIRLIYDTTIMEWDEVPNATMYNIYESDSPDGEFILIDTTTTNFWLHWETASRKFYRVRAATGS